MIEHIVPVESGINHAAVVTKKVKDCMDGMIDDIDVKVISEYFLFNSGLKQFPGHAVITDFNLSAAFTVVGLCRALQCSLHNAMITYRGRVYLYFVDFGFHIRVEVV